VAGGPGWGGVPAFGPEGRSRGRGRRGLAGSLRRDALNVVLNARFWTGAVTATQAVKEVEEGKERGDPVLKG
jgi:hypothetical protein